jgi:hypothetical protein
VAAALLLAAAWLLLEPGDAPRPGRPASAPVGAGATPMTGEPPPRAPRAAAAPSAPSPAGRAPTAAAPARPIPVHPPDDLLDTPAWRSARLAFRPRELGALGPYVRQGLASARREMASCFGQAGATAPPDHPEADPDDDAPPPPSSEPAVLLLFLEARQGALDVIDARAEVLGSVPAEQVACCIEALRGREIPVLGAEPGRRYRLKLRLP